MLTQMTAARCSSSQADSRCTRRKRSDGDQAHGSPAARSQRPWARGHPGSRRYRAGSVAPRHRHPGEEIIYVLEGSLAYEVEGKPPVTLKAGDVLFIPAGTVHSARNVGTVNAAELATYVVEKGKPLVELAQVRAQV